MKKVKIRIAGDLFLKDEYDLDLVNPNLLDLFDKDSFNIVNLECPILYNDKKKLLKQVPTSKETRNLQKI